MASRRALAEASAKTMRAHGGAVERAVGRDHLASPKAARIGGDGGAAGRGEFVGDGVGVDHAAPSCGEAGRWRRSCRCRCRR
jgi:hypothetical protein